MTVDPAGSLHIQEEMAGLTGAGARARTRELAAIYGVSEATIYRHSRGARRGGARRTRGAIRKPVSREVLDEMVAMSIQDDATATDVIRVFEKNGRLRKYEISAAWFTRYLKRAGLSRREMKKDLRPYRRFEASEPGELLQVDGSTALQWYIDDDGSVGWESTVSRNKNRPGNRKRRLEFFIGIDDHSRAVYGEFLLGKTVNHWLNFLFNTFRKKDDPRFIFHGLPQTIYMDNDVVAKVRKFRDTFKKLGVKIKHHRPTKKNDRYSNARSKGKVERFIGYVSQRMRLTRNCRFRTLAEANEFMFELCLEYNLRSHSTTGEAPFQRWMKIRPEMLIQCEDDKLYEALYRDEFTCYVYPKLTIRLDGEWQLPWEEPFWSMAGQKVTVFRHPLEPDRIAVQWDGREYAVEREPGVVRTWSEGPVRQVKTNRQELIGKYESIDLSQIQRYGFDRGPDESLGYLPARAGTELELPEFAPKAQRIQRAKAMMMILERLGLEQFDDDSSRYLLGYFDEWVTEEEIEAAYQRLTEPAVPEAARAG